MDRLTVPWPTAQQLQDKTGIDTPVKSVAISVEDYEAARLALIELPIMKARAVSLLDLLDDIHQQGLTEENKERALTALNDSLWVDDNMPRIKVENRPCNMCGTNPRCGKMTRCKPCNRDYMRDYNAGKIIPAKRRVASPLSTLLAMKW